MSRKRLRIDALEQNPRNSNVIKLTAKEELYRTRTGNYRILFEINGAALEVYAISIRHRSDVYRGI